LKVPNKKIESLEERFKNAGIRKIDRDQPSLSNSEIREKVELRKQENDKVEITKKKNNVKLGAGFMSDEKAQVVAVNKQKLDSGEEKILITESFKNDLNKNDPNDDTTKEKLKSVLEKNAFNFSAKEREVLSKIVT